MREYQNPDAGAKDLALTKTAKAKGKKEKGGDTHVCFHCGKSGAKLRSCAQCRRAWYCGRDCQAADWKRHKQACRAAVAAEARRATRAREATAAARAAGGRAANEECVVCMGPVVAPVELPCGHAYCGACLAELRAKGVAQACPLCRAELPPGVEGLYELAMRSVMRIQGMVTRGEMAWASLPTAEQEEIDEAVAMLREAGAQGHAGANLSLGILLQNERKDIDGAEAAYRAAIAADPGHALAHCNLGVLLENERKDIDGAEAAYRAAIAADPGDADAHCTLGTLLVQRAQQIEESGGDLAKAADMYDEVVEHYVIAVGTEHPAVKGQQENAARVRAMLK